MIGVSDPTTIAARTAVCAMCDRMVDKAGDPLYVFIDALGGLLPGANTMACGECGCSVYVIARVANKQCPLDKWE